jgi:hypothetical protein
MDHEVTGRELEHVLHEHAGIKVWRIDVRRAETRSRSAEGVA